ncbi:OsmC family protein [Robbsia sp. Bb-Pol-6]|uniref:OsmC family protein n=1 Tax=Robbsia betulipollinis TaxID=2981849 RepID=A0ABT3ZIC4_9BURK|nr:OsmC family protein [Robbsia betulipollinis]MCY0386276.1 OsmC family protein [Robbsia betulipollinis]
MAHGEHTYDVSVQWTGNQGSGTSGYSHYGRDHVIRAAGKPDVPGSSDPVFRGDAGRWNPEELLVAAAAACHKLWYLHLCAEAGIVVLAYVDHAIGTMVEGPQSGAFAGITLRPQVTLRVGDDRDLAERLHHVAHEKCYIANSVNFPIVCEPTSTF